MYAVKKVESVDVSVRDLTKAYLVSKDRSVSPDNVTNRIKKLSVEFKGDITKAVEAYARLVALKSIVSSGSLPDWVLDNAVPTGAAILAWEAASKEPLLCGKFDTTSFLSRILLTACSKYD